MTQPNVKLTRAQMQTEARIIESLLDAAMAMFSGLTPGDAFALIDMAHDRAKQPKIALDSVNAVEAKP
ncbi:hypothetical protein [Citreimonas sp.]|uniref:hypothetical protein n=1 Tax=Citreimonas sp. TaxID=3036715 RepID=UPI004058B2DD